TLFHDEPLYYCMPNRAKMHNELYCSFAAGIASRYNNKEVLTFVRLQSSSMEDYKMHNETLLEL
ncbi:MAG: hypothetical protein KAJ59_04805, partial [Thermodesulfovibrionia bacterium]|nr:hypothetical protein [Thermodesulfovibrionia bacterium]